MPRMYVGDMIDHFGINCSDRARSRDFYDKVLGVLGYGRVLDMGPAIGYGTDGKPTFWIADASTGDAGGPTGRCTSRSRPTAGGGAGVLPRRAGAGRRTAARTTAVARIPRELLRGVRPRSRRQQRRGGLPWRWSHVAEAPAVQELLRDAFTRLIEHVDALTDGLSERDATFRPTPQANSIAWLLWHSARVQDAQVADIAGSSRCGRPTAGWTGSAWICRAATPATATPRTTSARCGRRRSCWPTTTGPCTR